MLLTDNNLFYSCMWDIEAGKRSLDFEAHAGDVVSISLSPDIKTYVTGSVDKSCRLWDLREETPKQTFFGHSADVNSVYVSISVINICLLVHIWHLNILYKQGTFKNYIYKIRERKVICNFSCIFLYLNLIFDLQNLI